MIPSYSTVANCDIFNNVAKFLNNSDTLNVKLCNKTYYNNIKIYNARIKSDNDIIIEHEHLVMVNNGPTIRSYKRK